MKYIEKFTADQQDKIRKVVAHEMIYQDVNESVYKQELNKWIKALENETEFEMLRKKC